MADEGMMTPDVRPIRAGRKDRGQPENLGQMVKVGRSRPPRGKPDAPGKGNGNGRGR